MKETKYKKGVLLLVDVVDFTSQANRLGTEKTHRFILNLEKIIKAITTKYKGEFIKTIGDGLLIFFADEEKFLDFACQLRNLSRSRQLDHGEFFADLRMVAHMRNYSFEFFQDKIKDLIGTRWYNRFPETLHP